MHANEVSRHRRQLTLEQWLNPVYTANSSHWDVWFAVKHEEQRRPKRRDGLWCPWGGPNGQKADKIAVRLGRPVRISLMTSSLKCAEFAGQRSSCSGFEPNYDPDGGLSDSDSLEDSSASTDDENVSRQKRLLEDALFGFFKKEVLYLDKLHFGVRVVDQGVPRTTAWKGNLIKHFSELDRKRSNLFGRRQFKKHSSYLMVNKMSPLTRTNLSNEFNEKDCQKDNTVENAAHAANQVSKCINKLGTKEEPIPLGDMSPQPPTLVVERLLDVKITSPTSFGVRQSQLAKNADALYNNMLAPVVNRQHQTATTAEDITYMPMKTSEHIIIDEIEKELDNNYDAKDDLIIVKEKKLLTLPFEQNTRFPVFEEECKNYNTIIELAYTKGVQKNYALMFPRVHCNYISLGQCLMPTGHMDNFLLPCICRKFFEDCHPTVSGRHHFFPHIGENILNYRSNKQLKTIAMSFVGAASASRRKRLDNSHRVFFPIVIQGHWIVFAVDFHYKLFAFLDSHYGKDSNFHTSIREKMIDNFINLWEIIFQTKEHNFRTFKRMYPHVPKQGNENDCGIFVVKFMELWEPAMDLRKCFSQADITHIRIQYMNQLYFWSKNSTDKRVVTDFNLEGDFVGNHGQ
ncbi:hypothetical protein D1007_23748 [Hordeum vulgare]|nr:hypothetical protein D1007_23748 [Hordeum vulgare]